LVRPETSKRAGYQETIPEWGQTARLVKEQGRAEVVDGDALLPASTQFSPILEWSPERSQQRKSLLIGLL